MPANKKHLSSPWHRILKITTGFGIGYIITQAFFMVLMNVWDARDAILTLEFAGFILWATLLILAFIAKNPYKILVLYTIISILLMGLVYLTE